MQQKLKLFKFPHSIVVVTTFNMTSRQEKVFLWYVYQLVISSRFLFWVF